METKYIYVAVPTVVKSLKCGLRIFTEAAILANVSVMVCKNRGYIQYGQI